MLGQDLGMNQTFLPYPLFPMSWFQYTGAIQLILNLSAWDPELGACWVMDAYTHKHSQYEFGAYPSAIFTYYGIAQTGAKGKRYLGRS